MHIPSILSSIWIMLVFSLFACIPLKHIETKTGPTGINQWAQKDQLENFYRIEGQNTLIKFDRNGVILNEYMHPVFGSISSFDVSDPYKILLFYKGHQHLEILDNTLNPISGIDLNELDGRYVEVVAMAEDGAYWIFDSNDQVLIKISGTPEVIEQSFPIYQEGINGFKPSYMAANGRMVLLGDPETGIIWFDHLGNFKKLFRKTGFDQIICSEKYFYFSDPNGLFVFDPILFEEQKIYEFDSDSNYNYCFDPDNQTLILIEADFKGMTLKRLYN